MRVTFNIVVVAETGALISAAAPATVAHLPAVVALLLVAAAGAATPQGAVSFRAHLRLPLFVLLR